MMKIKGADLQEEYENAVNRGNEIIKRIAPLKLSEQSIEDIHYWYRYAADLLIQKGDPITKIVTKLYEDFEQFYGERHIWRILKEGGITIPDSTDISQQKDSPLLTDKVLSENKEYHEMLVEVEKAVAVMKSKLSKPFCSLYQDKKMLGHVITTGKGLAKVTIEAGDERQLVLTAAQPELLHCAIEYALTDAYTHYLNVVKDVMKKMSADTKLRGIRTLEKITGKQVNRILSLNVKEVHESLDPATPLEARMKGFSGQECTKCYSLRCNRMPDATIGRWYKCSKCDHAFEGKIIPPYTKGVVIDAQSHT